MKHAIKSLFPFLLIFLLSAPVSVFGQSHYMSVEEIKPGMTGYGKTVLEGNRITTFDIEVLGVIKNWSSAGDAILIRSDDPKLKESGIIEGMSGSPIYVDDKMIGAVAFGWSFTKSTIAGVTPIHQMLRMSEDLKMMERIELSGDQHTTLFDNYTTQKMIQRYRNDKIAYYTNKTDTLQPISSYYFEKYLNQLRRPALNSTASMSPIGFPLVARGLSPSGYDRLSEMFTGTQLTLLQSTATGSAPAETSSATVEPGASLFLKLVEGDIDLSMVGTLTEVAGDTLYAYGHPVFLDGKIEFPVSTGIINAVIPNQQASFKLGCAGETIGTAILDESTGMVAKLGQKPKMVKLHLVVSVQGEDTEPVTKEYNFQIVNSKVWTPEILAYILSDVTTLRGYIPDQNILSASYDIKIEGLPDLKIDRIYSGAGSINGFISDLVAPVFAFLNNEFKKVTITEVTCELDVTYQNKLMSIKSVQTDKSTVAPGEAIKLLITFLSYRKDELTKTFSLEIPKNIPEGYYVLMVSDPETNLYTAEYESPGDFQINNVNDIYDYFNKPIDKNGIVVTLSYGDFGIAQSDVKLPDLPGSYISIFASARKSDLQPIYRPVTFTFKTDHITRGQVSIPILIQKKED